MQPREINYFQDMLNAAKLAQDFVAGIDWETFELDLMRQAAVTRQFEIMGEAARRISTDTQGTFPNIPGSQIIGMRNRLIHKYDDIDLELIWDTVEIALPESITMLETIIDNQE
ncbi:MAG: DUF86 domain-containing protein [Limnospira sp.]|jgi:uncharacterized protein with HEPN domain